jgi:hypothetical protein
MGPVISAEVPDGTFPELLDRWTSGDDCAARREDARIGGVGLLQRRGVASVPSTRLEFPAIIAICQR